EESAAAGKESEQKGPSFVTQEDVVAMLEKELSRSQEDWKYIPQPPYPSSLLQQPYPKGYETPNFHVSRFIDALGPHAGDYNLRLREFSKSLTDRAYTWYTTLAPGSIRSWDDLAGRVCKKYFQHEERVTTTQLNNTRQKYGEDPVDFVRRFRDLALDCYDEKDEEALVEICISNIVADYRVYLENIGISQFSRLLEAVRKTSMSVKPTGQRTWRNEKKEAHQTLAVDDKPSNDYSARKRKDRETYPPLPCKDEEFHAILDTMIADGAIKPLRPYKVPTREEKNDPRKILHGKIHEGVLELPSKRQIIDEDPLPKRRGKEIVAVITCSGDLLDDDEPCHPWRDDPKPPEAIWEPCGNMEKAFWRKYSKPPSYDAPWPLAQGWDDCTADKAFTLGEQCLGAFAGQQETAAVTFHALTEAETTVMERYL
ncbi:PREDICTED: retrotransposon, partial [Prunus dulcis]